MTMIKLKDVLSWKFQIALNELDTSYTKEVFDVQVEVWQLNYFFRCTVITEDNNVENKIEFLEEDSDKCETKCLEFMKDRITEVYL